MFEGFMSQDVACTLAVVAFVAGGFLLMLGLGGK